MAKKAVKRPNVSGLRRDLDAERDGIWVTDSHGIEVRLARWNHPGHKRLLRKIREKYRKDLDEDTDGELADRLNREVFADEIVRDWKPFMDGEKEWTYSPENARALLADHELDVLYAGWINLSMKEDDYRKERIQGAAKQLGNASSGT